MIFPYANLSAVDGDEAVSTHLSRRDLIDIAPSPFFARFGGAHERMIGLTEVFRGVLVFGRIAAANVTALQAHA